MKKKKKKKSTAYVYLLTDQFSRFQSLTLPVLLHTALEEINTTKRKKTEGEKRGGDIIISPIWQDGNRIVLQSFKSVVP